MDFYETLNAWKSEKWLFGFEGLYLKCDIQGNKNHVLCRSGKKFLDTLCIYYIYRSIYYIKNERKNCFYLFPDNILYLEKTCLTDAVCWPLIKKNNKCRMLYSTIVTLLTFVLFKPLHMVVLKRTLIFLCCFMSSLSVNRRIHPQPPLTLSLFWT